MREKEYSEWMSKQGFDVLRHGEYANFDGVSV